MKGKRRITVIMTCHNRRVLTLAALEALHVAAAAAPVALHVVLTDDGSTDGTAQAVAERWPAVEIVRGDGSLYWNRGMLAAWRAACAHDADFTLWLNDDLALAPTAIADLIESYDAAGGGRTIVAGHTVDPDSAVTTYGVYTRGAGTSRLRFRHLTEGETRGVTMNGNCVLIPACAVSDIGMLDPAYTHSSGDVDYGLRASARGYAIVQPARPVGRQPRNADYDRATSRMTLANARHILTHPKGVPVREWLHFTRAHGGSLWPVNFLVRYAKMMMAGSQAAR